MTANRWADVYLWLTAACAGVSMAPYITMHSRRPSLAHAQKLDEVNRAARRCIGLTFNNKTLPSRGLIKLEASECMKA